MSKSGKNCYYSNTKFVITIKYAKIIKSVLIFRLFNLLLVWVIKKLPLLLNLYLVFIEYYKKRIEFQLKEKKEIYINKHISTNFTKFTRLTRLQLLTK